MTADTWFVLKVICGVLAGLFGVAAAVLMFFDVKADDDQSRAQAWFEARWTALDRSAWLFLTEWLLSENLRQLRRLSGLPTSVGRWLGTPTGTCTFGVGTPVVFSLSSAVVWGPVASTIAAALTAPFAVWFVSVANVRAETDTSGAGAGTCSAAW